MILGYKPPSQALRKDNGVSEIIKMNFSKIIFIRCIFRNGGGVVKKILLSTANYIVGMHQKMLQFVIRLPVQLLLLWLYLKKMTMGCVTLGSVARQIKAFIKQL
jgi:hypothetical protein